MKKKGKLLFLLLMLVFAMIMPTQAQAKLKISKKTVTLIKGQTTTLKVKGAKRKAKWTSSKKRVAAVNQKGKVTAKKKGTTTITAQINGKKLKCKVKVEDPRISAGKVSLYEGARVSLKIKGTKRKATWYSSNPDIASVDQNGNVLALKSGTAIIRAKISKKYFSCIVTVAPNPIKEDNSPGSRKNPLSAYNLNTVTIKSDSPVQTTFSLQLVEMIDGAYANQIVEQNGINELSGTDNRWILYHFKLSYLTGTTELHGYQVVNTEYFYNDSSVIGLNTCETAFLPDDKPSIYDLKLYPGGSGDMWIGMLVSNSVPYTTFKINTGYDNHYNQTETWFTTKIG